MLLKKLFRTAWKYKAQFISMIIMVAIGIGVFVGFNMEWYFLQKDTDRFMSQTNYADYRVYNEHGFSESDIQAIKEIDGVTAATRVLNVNVNIKDSKNSLALFVPEEYTVSSMQIMNGEAYDKASDGFWISDKFAAANGIEIGDILIISYKNIEIGGVIAGLVKSSEFMVCVSDSNQLMPDYTSFGFVYASPEKIKTALGGVMFYPQINLLSDMEKPQMEAALKTALGKTTLALGKMEHTSYAAAKGEIEEGQTMVSILPVLFLLIGVLTMITTMHRITANEKTQIGTLKALGFKNDKILRHYTSYGLFIGLIGTVLGVALGFSICALIVNPTMFQGTYFDMPYWGLSAPWWTWLILAVIVAFLTLISFLSVKNMLKSTAADALRPYTPKKMKPLAIEKTKVWNKIGFATKWNLRDVFRHKIRSAMTLVGILGCMVLLVGGLGMSDTMSGFLLVIDEQILQYETRVNFTETATNEQAEEFAFRYDGDYKAVQSVQLDGNPVSLEIYSVDHEYVKFIDSDNQNVTLESDGVYICKRIENKGYRVGDTLTFSPYGSDESYTVKIAGVLRSMMTENIAMTTDYAEEAGISYQISEAFFNCSPDGMEKTDYITSTQSKAAIMDSYDSFMSIMNAMVLVFILAAVVLGIVVLYNLGVMSYVERYRELSTLKVVGFKNKQIGRILISQNLWLTVIGILLGLPTGVGTLYLLIIMLASEYEMKVVIGAFTYCVSILLTFGVSLIVGLFVARKNRKIDMAEALKGRE